MMGVAMQNIDQINAIKHVEFWTILFLRVTDWIFNPINCFLQHSYKALQLKVWDLVLNQSWKSVIFICFRDSKSSQIKSTQKLNDDDDDDDDYDNE